METKGTNAFFSIRPTRRSNPESRTTLDALHKFHMERITTKKTSLSTIQEQYETLIDELKSCTSVMERSVIEEKRDTCEKEIKNLQSDSELYDYFLDTGDILYNYYDIQEKIQNGTHAAPKRVSTKAKPGSILAALEVASKENDVSGTPLRSKKAGEELRRDKLLEEYLQRIDPEHARGSHEIEFESFGLRVWLEIVGVEIVGVEIVGVEIVRVEKE